MAATHVISRPKPLHIQNRKYIGSKFHLLDFIAGVVADRAPEAHSFGDLFCGSGVVAHHFAARGLEVTTVDNLYHNWVAARCFLGGAGAQSERLPALLAELAAVPPVDGYCCREYGGTYFTLQNAARIDAVREQIAAWSLEEAISVDEEMALLTSLIYAADKVANTCGQYDAFLKHLGEAPYSVEGVHQVDASVYKQLELGLPMARSDSKATALCGDANQLIHQIDCDLLYLDPPYNGRQYVDNYHVLENIARWEKPLLYGKTRKFARDGLKSAYSSRRSAAASLAHIIASARCRHLLLSYNNEGIVADEEIVTALKRRGRVEIFTREYSIFGNGAGRSLRRPIVERLFYCQVSTPPGA